MQSDCQNGRELGAMRGPRESEGGVEQHNRELQMAGDVTSSSSVASSPKEDLSLSALTEFLDLDDRPTLILDLKCTPSPALIYHNASLGELKHREVEVGRQIVDAFGKASKDMNARPILEWAQSTNGLFPSITYQNVRWSSNTIRQRWRIITGTVESTPNEERRQSISLDPPRLPRLSTAPIQSRLPITSYPLHRAFDALPETSRLREEWNVPIHPLDNSTSAEIGHESLGKFDMTCHSPNIAIRPFMEFFRAFDWGDTSFGPIKEWSPVFRRMCNIMLSDPRPAALFHGKDKAIMYNESYVLVTGERHPLMLGKSFVEAWPEIHEWFLPKFDSMYTVLLSQAI